MLNVARFMDLHNHSVWSDGADTAVSIIQNAINNKIEVIGISDHFCGNAKNSVGYQNLKLYLRTLNKLKVKYSTSITVLIGIEISYSFLLQNHKEIPFDVINELDFVLLENLDYIPTKTKLEEVGLLLSEITCSKGLAHTDLAILADKFIERGYIDYVIDFMKCNNIFWEINTSSTHDIFFDILYNNTYTQKTQEVIDKIILNRIPVSVGSDTHSLAQYNYNILKRANDIANFLNQID